MKKIFLLLIVLMFLGGCYTQVGMYDEPAPRYDEVSVYIDYNFNCGYCYYETYYCFNCGYWHTHITSWCHHHYGWYNDWYVVNYYHPYYYYYNHWHSHYYYADYNRHYRHDTYGLRNMGSRNYSDNESINKSINKVKRNENTYPRIYNKQDNKQQHINKTTPPVKQNNTVKQNNRTQTKNNNTGLKNGK
jgi:hypothetical protein